jgi:hypothetical protein
MRYLLLATLLIPSALAAQAPAAAPADEKAAVMAVVTRLFDGMRKGDSAMIRSAFHPGATLTTATLGQNQTLQRVQPIDGFVRSVGVPRPEALDERIKNEIVHIDGALASVWVDYSLYIGTRFSHCGVDAFQLVKTPDGWKITALADTRRQTGCG